METTCPECQSKERYIVPDDEIPSGIHHTMVTMFRQSIIPFTYAYVLNCPDCGVYTVAVGWKPLDIANTAQ